MLSLDITREEIESGQMSQAHLVAAVDAMRTDGFVILNDVVDRSHLDLLRDRMLADAEKILARKDVPFNFNSGNIQQMPPPFPPYLFRDVLVNDMVIAVTQALMGKGVKLADYTGNTALPGERKQPVHPDIGHLWPNMEQATPPFAIVINVPVVDMDARNGSTEIWPGTHLDTSKLIWEDIKVPEEKLREREKIAPPLQPSVRAGSVVIRDMRLWHRGMPNFTDTPRPMIALIHWARWWNNGAPLQFPKGTEEYFQHPDLTVHAEFVDGLADHIQHGEAYDFQK
jgi:hypothetical protein